MSRAASVAAAAANAARVRTTHEQFTCTADARRKGRRRNPDAIHDDAVGTCLSVDLVESELEGVGDQRAWPHTTRVVAQFNPPAAAHADTVCV